MINYTMGKIAKETLRKIKNDIVANVNDLANPLRRAGITLNGLKIQLKWRAEEKFAEKHEAEIAEIEAPLIDVIGKTKDSFIRHDYYHELVAHKGARALLTMPIEELEIRVRKTSDTKVFYGDYSAQFLACKKAWELRTGKVYEAQALAKTA